MSSIGGIDGPQLRARNIDTHELVERHRCQSIDERGTQFLARVWDPLLHDTGSLESSNPDNLNTVRR